MPYRVNLSKANEDALDRLVDLGALDVEPSNDSGIAALMPDSVTPEQLAGALGMVDIVVSPAVGRDADSIWVLSHAPIRIGRVRIVPAHADAEPGALGLIDAPAFGTGLHPTTALCLETLDEAVPSIRPGCRARRRNGLGRARAGGADARRTAGAGIDIDDEALRVAAEKPPQRARATRVELRAAGRKRSRARGRSCSPTSSPPRSSRWRRRSCGASVAMAGWCSPESLHQWNPTPIGPIASSACSGWT